MSTDQLRALLVRYQNSIDVGPPVLVTSTNSSSTVTTDTDTSTADTLVAAGRRWKPEAHPRDRRGRFIEKGAVVDLLSAKKPTVQHLLNAVNELNQDDWDNLKSDQRDRISEQVDRLPSGSKLADDAKAKIEKLGGAPRKKTPTKPSVTKTAPSPSGKLAATTVYRKHADGTVVAESPDGTRRMRWDAGQKKYAVERRDDNDTWTTTNTLNKGTAYEDLKKPGRWVAPGTAVQQPAEKPTSTTIVTGNDALDVAEFDTSQWNNVDLWTTIEGQSVNALLRGDTESDLYPEDDDDRDNVQAIIDDLDDMFNTAPPINKSIKLWRGVGDARTFMGDNATGKTFTDVGFISTTPNRDAAEKYAVLQSEDAEGGALIELTIPAGTKAVTVARVDPDEEEFEDIESEVLIPRNSSFHVISDERLPDGTRLVKATIVPSDAQPAEKPDVTPTVTTPKVQPAVPTPITLAQGTPLKATAAYVKVDDGVTIARSLDDNRRLRWDGTRRKFIAERRDGDLWVEVDALTKGRTYEQLKEPGRWVAPGAEPGQTEQTGTNVEPPSSSLGTETSSPVVEPQVDVPWKPRMSRSDAQKFTVGTKITTPLFHGTSASAAAQLRSHGFDPGKSGSGGTNNFGAGLYLTGDKAAAGSYAQARGGESVEFAARILNPLASDDVDVARARVAQQIFGPLVAMRRALGTDSSAVQEFRKTLDTDLNAPISDEDVSRYALPEGTTKRDFIDMSASELDDVLGAAEQYAGSGNWVMSEYIQRRGYDAVMVGDSSAPDEVVVFKPQQLVAITIPEAESVAPSTVPSGLSSQEADELADALDEIQFAQTEARKHAERDAEVNQKAGAGKILTKQDIADQQKAWDKLESLRATATPAALKALDLFMKRDGEPWGSVDTDEERSRWVGVGKPSVVATGKTPADETQKSRDLYVMNDKKTIEQNASLRSGSPSPSAKTWRTRMNKMVNSATLLNDAKVFRGAAFTPEMIASLRPGKILTDPGIMSTDEDAGTAEFYAKTRMDRLPGTLKTMFTIRAPKGTPAVDVGYGEYVFGSNSRMRIVSVERVGDRVNVVTEMLSPTASTAGIPNQPKTIQAKTLSSPSSLASPMTSSPASVAQDTLKFTPSAADLKSDTDEAIANGTKRRSEYAALGPLHAKVADLVAGWTLQDSFDELRKLRTRLSKKNDLGPVIDVMRNGPTAPLLYRGIKMSETKAQDLEPGKVIGLRNVASFTSNAEHAEGFGRVVIELSGAHGLPVAGISNSPSEHEWLVTDQIEVTDVTSRHTKTTLLLKQLPITVIKARWKRKNGV